MKPLPVVDPLPALVAGRIPWVGSAVGLLRDPTGWFSRQRSRHGDTFVVDALGHRFFCVFGPEGVRSLYALPEHKASFGLATYAMIRNKVPDELFSDIRNPPHKLFGSQQVETYLGNLDTAMQAETSRLGSSGSFEVFAEARRIGHRLGLASWAGDEAASPAHFERLVGALDHIDESFADVEQPRRDQLVARDVIVLHLGSQSNLFAALAWTIVRLLNNRADLDAVTAGDHSLLDRYAYESIRVAQRSITMRQVLRPVEMNTDQGVFRVAPGAFITTMLSVTNTTADPHLADFDVGHYDGRRLVLGDGLAAKELVSTFGHGIHMCPAQRFSISAIRTAVVALLGRYELTSTGGVPGPLTRQIGGVARADRPCRVQYRARSPISS